MKVFGFLLGAGIGQDCRLCGQVSMQALCEGCEGDLPRLPANLCPVCALPTPDGSTCGRCLADTPAFDSTCAAFEYAFPVTRLIQSFKYRNAVGLASTLGAWLDAVIPRGSLARTDLVVPLPLAGARLRERGYNQALEIARALAARRILKLDYTAVARLRHTPAQADLPWKERRRNIRGAFAATRRFDGLSVAVVDDVMTTGTTLDEMARTLKQAGAARVVNWVVARTLRQPDRTRTGA